MTFSHLYQSYLSVVLIGICALQSHFQLCIAVIKGTQWSVFLFLADMFNLLVVVQFNFYSLFFFGWLDKIQLSELEMDHFYLKLHIHVFAMVECNT